MAWNKITRGTEQNGFVNFYMDEGFNEQIYQWDTNFMAAFGMYASNLFPAIQSLDNFYNKQRDDGYIQRVYNESNGKEVAEPTVDEPMINPPLFAWIEWRYYQITGDKSRLKNVLPHLNKYYDWINENLRDSLGQGLHYTTQLGSGMDNIPRPNVGKAGWIDLSAQMALSAKMIVNIASVVGDNKTVLKFTDEYSRLTKLINQLCWDEDSQFYYDLREDGKLSNVKHIGGFWTLLSETATRERAEALFKHLGNPDEFWRPHMVPALAANQSMYDSSGHYWLGGVWAPTNYMVIKGLEKYGQYELADQIAENHLYKMAEVYYEFQPDEEKIAFEERYEDGYQTIWECYSPEFPEPATRWDDTFYSRQDFVGWSGLGPIALLIENVIGIEMNIPQNQITWRIDRTDEHGIKNLNYLDGKVSLLVEPKDEKLSFSVTSTHRFDLLIIYNGESILREINVGSNLFIIE
jgi:neutral trehalase